MNVEERLRELEEAYRARYGEDAVVRIQDNGPIKNTPYRNVQIWYRNDEGVVKCNSEVYLFIDDAGNAEWYGRDPTKLPERRAPFSDILEEKIHEEMKKGAILYGEVLSVNERAERARVFIKTETEEGVYIVGVDEAGKLTKQKTSFERIG